MGEEWSELESTSEWPWEMVIPSTHGSATAGLLRQVQTLGNIPEVNKACSSKLSLKVGTNQVHRKQDMSWLY